MEKLMLFLNIIAWVGAIISTIFAAICIYATITYPGSTDELFDKMRGIRRTYPTAPWFIAAVICWAFIIAF